MKASFALFALVLVLATPPAGANPAWPPGPVPRFEEESLAAVALVRAANRLVGGCTAVLIDVDRALTAGHCAEGALSGPSAMQLVFHPNDPSRTRRITVSAVSFHADATGDWSNSERAATDLALLRLAQEVPAEVATPLALAPSKREDWPETVAIYGYPHGSGEVLRGHGVCRLGIIATGLLGSDCHVVGGMSGAPVLSGEPGSWRVEGIVVGSIEDDAIRAIIVDLVPFPAFRGFGVPLPGQSAPASAIPGHAIPAPSAAPPSESPETSP